MKYFCFFFVSVCVCGCMHNSPPAGWQKEYLSRARIAYGETFSSVHQKLPHLKEGYLLRLAPVSEWNKRRSTSSMLVDHGDNIRLLFNFHNVLFGVDRVGDELP
jgi:hypothetical protein